MNEYKVWDKENKCWNKGNLSLTPDGKLYECYGDGCYKFEPINDKSIIVFSTGLKDKNGNLIYEGDICKIDWKDSRYGIATGIVEWDGKEGSWSFGAGSTSEVHWSHEVIGNIYEDKELLTKTGE